MTATSHQVASQQGGSLTGNVTAAPTPVTGGKLGVPQRPQVNLLPAEVTHRRQVAAAQRRMVWAILATILVIVLAFGGSFLVRANAALNHEEALGRADELLQQRREYSPVIEVKDNITSTVEARSFVLSNEVDWSSYVYALSAVMPEGVLIANIAVEAPAAGEELVEGADALTTNAIGIITFEAISLTLPVASEWVDAIESIPGLEDANIQSSELNSEEGLDYYDVFATVQVTREGAADREFSDLLATDIAPEDGATDEESGDSDE